MTEKLVVYDVRGIQNYIFRTNTLKEIIGASLLVDGKVMELFAKAIKEVTKDAKIDLDWKENKNDFNSEDNDIEVIYEGGGNIFIYFKDEDMMNSVNKQLNILIFKEMSGISLAVASVSMSDDYEKDRIKLMDELGRIKLMNPMITSMGNLPITMQDPITGLPLCMNTKDFVKYGESRKISLESYQKLKKYYENYKQINSTSNNRNQALEFDDMVKNKGEDSFIAVVHIDGNSMGSRIKGILENTKDYVTAVRKMRNISKSIYETFDVKGVKAINDKINELVNQDKIKLNNNHLPYRMIIAAGDDITFVCRGDLALIIVETFINSVKEGYMYQCDDNKESYRCSSCAGIALIHSHFPFALAYEYAEECCGSAKKRAKNNMDHGKVGNYVDFQICYSGMLTDLDSLRERNYINGDYNLCKRPYDIDNMNETCRLSDFKKQLQAIKKIPRSWAKSFRDGYYEDESVLRLEVAKAASRKHVLGNDDLYINNVATYYDSLELMDMWGDSYE